MIIYDNMIYFMMANDISRERNNIFRSNEMISRERNSSYPNPMDPRWRMIFRGNEITYCVRTKWFRGNEITYFVRRKWFRGNEITYFVRTKWFRGNEITYIFSTDVPLGAPYYGHHRLPILPVTNSVHRGFLGVDMRVGFQLRGQTAWFLIHHIGGLAE